MSLEGLKKAASSYDRLPLTHQTAGSPHWHPCDSSFVCTRTPGDCGSSTAPNMEKFPERPGVRGLPGTSDPSRVQVASCRLRSPLEPKLFLSFFSALARSSRSATF